jgi:hypothetical protein
MEIINKISDKDNQIKIALLFISLIKRIKNPITAILGIVAKNVAVIGGTP